MATLDDIFKFNNYSAGGKLPHDGAGGIRHLHKSFNETERNLYNNWWQEQIFQFGTEVDYYTSNYSLTGHDSLYGEEPTREYASPVKMVVALELNESAIVLNQFGLVGDDEITGYIAIDTFYHQLSTAEITSPEPKSGDVFKLTEYGSESMDYDYGLILNYKLTRSLSCYTQLEYLNYFNRENYTINLGINFIII